MTPRELASRFAAYYRDHPTWGSLHIVLDDQNVADSNVDSASRTRKNTAMRKGRSWRGYFGDSRGHNAGG